MPVEWTSWTSLGQLPSESWAHGIGFIGNQFVDEAIANTYRSQVIMPFAEDACPPGWAQQRDTLDGALLFYAYGLKVDENGVPRSPYVRMPACIKE